MQYKSAKSISNSSDERFLAKYLNFARLLERKPGQLIQAVHSKIRHKNIPHFCKNEEKQETLFRREAISYSKCFHDCDCEKWK